MARPLVVAFACILLAGCVVNTQPSTVHPLAAVVPPNPVATGNITVARTVVADQRFLLNAPFSLNADCTSVGNIVVRIISSPAHGQVTIEEGMAYPAYPANNQRYACNLKKYPTTVAFYQPQPGFKGGDAVVMETIFPNGLVQTVTFSLTVT